MEAEVLTQPNNRGGGRTYLRRDELDAGALALFFGLDDGEDLRIVFRQRRQTRLKHSTHTDRGTETDTQ